MGFVIRIWWAFLVAASVSFEPLTGFPTSPTLRWLARVPDRTFPAFRRDGSALYSTAPRPLDSDTIADARYYSFIEAPAQTHGSSTPRITITRYLNQAIKDNPELVDLESILLALQMACKTISNLVHRAGLAYSIERPKSSSDDLSDGRFYSMERLDSLSTIVSRNALKFTGRCEVVAPQKDADHEHDHQPGVLIAKCYDSPYVTCLDPLDGSGNADASICTGTVFGIFEQDEKDRMNGDAPDGQAEPSNDRVQQLVRSVLQPGKNMRAAGYCLYSSATVLVFTLGDSVQGFTLDPQINEFVLTHPNLTIPNRGSSYSCNEANSEGWDEGYKTYLRNLKLGQGETAQHYAHRYVGSMVGDVHRTLLYGGIFSYPRDTLSHPDGNLQLLYKSAPMAFVVHHAGGRAIVNGTTDLLDVKPDRVHQKFPCFMGSPGDVAELEKYLA
jgi:fructose-1,6-bisphosphatase I